MSEQHPSFDHDLADGVAEAVRELDAGTGGAAMCRIDADRATVVKRLEGRSTALRDLARRRRSHPGEDPAASLAAVRAHWSEVPRRSPLWMAYADGGLVALAELAEPGDAGADGEV